MVVYADILFCINLIVNYFLMLATARLCKREQHRWRALFSAAAGAVYAMILFVRGIPPWILLLSKLLMSAGMLLIAFPYRTLRLFVREYLVFFTVNFLFSGLMLALWLFFAPKGMVFYNGIVYFDLSALALVGYTMAAYLLTELFSRIYQKRSVGETMYYVTIELGQKQTMLTGFLDTGNTLTDAYTGYPVAICDFEAIRGILPVGMLDLFSQPVDLERLENLVTARTANHFKLIPYHTVGFSGILPAFRPDKMVLQGGSLLYPVENVYIAVSQQRLCKGDYDILLSPDMLPLDYAPQSRGQKAKVG